jgi:hypothetical protein
MKVKAINDICLLTNMETETEERQLNDAELVELNKREQNSIELDKAKKAAEEHEKIRLERTKNKQ